MFEFKEDSIVVKCWLKMIKEGKKTLEDVPNLWNLKDILTAIIERGEK